MGSPISPRKRGFILLQILLNQNPNPKISLPHCNFEHKNSFHGASASPSSSQGSSLFSPSPHGLKLPSPFLSAPPLSLFLCLSRSSRHFPPAQVPSLYSSSCSKICRECSECFFLMLSRVLLFAFRDAVLVLAFRFCCVEALSYGGIVMVLVIERGYCSCFGFCSIFLHYLVRPHGVYFCIFCWL